MLEVRAKLFHSLINMVGGFTRSLRLAAVERAFDTLRQVGKEDGSGSLPIVPWQGTPAAPPPDANPEKEAQRFGLDILPAEDPENPYELQLGGYCIVSVVQRGGVLIPADPAIGVARIQVRTTKKRRKKRREKEREKRSWGLAYHGGVGWGVGGSRRMDETRPRYGWRSLSLSLSHDLSLTHSFSLSLSLSLSRTACVVRVGVGSIGVYGFRLRDLSRTACAESPGPWTHFFSHANPPPCINTGKAHPVTHYPLPHGSNPSPPPQTVTITPTMDPLPSLSLFFSLFFPLFFIPLLYPSSLSLFCIPLLFPLLFPLLPSSHSRTTHSVSPTLPSDGW